ncbi:hypothetical protein JMM51_17260 [Rhodovulum sulfidophilum]|nr:hypothetical protein [Rhodovulum sulfidophilum]
MSEVIKVGLDLAKNLFQVHGANGNGNALLRKKLEGTQGLSSSPGCRPARWRWRPATVRISGGGN